MNKQSHSRSGEYLHPKHNKAHRRLRRSKQLLLLAAVIVLLAGVVSGSLAYLAADTTPVENTFTRGIVSCEIVEPGFKQGESAEKENVTIRNTGNTDAYIRARIVVTWQDENGNIYSKAPVAETDYTIEYAQNTSWVRNGDYYYYTTAVAPDECTEVLIKKCAPMAKVEAPDGYTFHVEILADAIQSYPDEAVGEAWGVSISNGSVSAYTDN